MTGLRFPTDHPPSYAPIDEPPAATAAWDRAARAMQLAHQADELHHDAGARDYHLAAVQKALDDLRAMGQPVGFKPSRVRGHGEKPSKLVLYGEKTRTGAKPSHY